ncbi:MAG: DUF5684 domain-containing protein [Actinomycetota bacterium]
MDYGNGYTDGAGFAALFVLIYGIIIGISVLFVIAVYVVTAFAFMSLYRKVGIKPWIAWVPFYNYWVWLELGGQPGWIALLSIVPYGNIVTLVFLGIGSHRTGVAFRKGGGYVALAVLLPFVWAFLLGSRNEVYDPSLITAAGYPPPRAGYGSVVPNYANVDYLPPTAPPTAPAA